jgi:nitrile hydratase beta subunit
MNGVHDLGGMHGFGPVDVDEGAPRLERWEAAVMAISRATRSANIINLDEFRHAIERMEPSHYLASPYFEHWLDGIARVLTEKAVIDRDVLEERAAYFRRHPDAAAMDVISVDPAPLVPAAPSRGFVRPEMTPPHFKPGDPVRARVMHTAGHTRLPRYLRGKRGVVQRYHGVHVFPDTNAHGWGEQPQPLYSVRFEAHELWGETAEPRQAVYLDAWEPYLEAV